MAKLTLDPAPTFSAPVPIPIAGGDPVPVAFNFKHKTREAFAAWLSGRDGKKKSAVIMEIADGWELDDAFNEANVERLLSAYMGAFDAIERVYVRELTAHREGN